MMKRTRLLGWSLVPVAMLSLAAGAGCTGGGGDETPVGDDDASSDVTPGATDTPTEQEPTGVELAVEGIGGESALQGLARLRVTSSGTRLDPMEGPSADAGSLQMSTYEITASEDLEAHNVRLDWERTITAIVDGAQIHYSEIVAGDRGIVEGVDSIFGYTSGDQGVMNSARVALVKKQHRLFNPHGLLLQAMAEPDSVTDHGTVQFDGRAHAYITVATPGQPVDLYIDAETGLITALETAESDHLLGDVTIQVRYEDWAAVGTSGLKFPYTVSLAMDAFQLAEETRSLIEVNPTLDSALFASALELTGTPVEADAARGDLTAQWTHRFLAFGLPFDYVDNFVFPELATTPEAPTQTEVYLFAGLSHASLAVRQSNGIVLIEAPLNEAHSLAVLDTLDTIWPGIPVTHVVATHFHHDHTGGLRTFVAQGATIVVGENSRAFFEEVFTAPHTLDPDSLQANPVTATLLSVPEGGQVVIEDAGDRDVEVHDIDVSHADDAVVAYVPALNLTFNSDMYTANDGATQGALFGDFVENAHEFYDALVALGLEGVNLTSGHSSAVRPFTDLLVHVGRRVEFPGATLYPEGIAADAEGNLYVGSLSGGAIYKVRPEVPPAEVFVEAGTFGQNGVVGILVDDARDILWACGYDYTGLSSVVRSFELETGDFKASYPMPASGTPSFCNDLILDPAGNLYVTDSIAQHVARLPAGGAALEIWATSEWFLNPAAYTVNGITWADGALLVGRYDTGALFRIAVNPDGTSGTITSIALTPAANSIDGLEALDDNTLIAVDNNSSLIRIELSGNTGAASTVQTGFNVATTVAVVEDSAWVLEGQLSCLIVPDSCVPVLPFDAVRVDLSAE